ncbi:hypothetical protein DIURU_002979 [Diutina rugosa]|uniref:DNA replication complex GINS protein PSF3 n=1 Tax=Diutina rugosa TaxID=5481 RepID=A0A642UN17_DIURU|nr:uncharacterized protein DIURU_002979 [Diutina rugosa]KAA8902185.1 hypothetical protein DIURU_002979 [Diutina rugosa]
MYYDLDDILADAQKVSCRFNENVPGLGYLEGNPRGDMEAGTKIDLPFWLASVLNLVPANDENTHTFLEIDNPEFVNMKVINAIKTSPTSVDLHRIAAHYYALIIKYCEMYRDEQLVATVMDMLRVRAIEINNFAFNANRQVHNDFLHQLDEWEKSLYKITSLSNKEMRSWQMQ